MTERNKEESIILYKLISTSALRFLIGTSEPLKSNKECSNLLSSAYRISNTLSIYILPFVVCICCQWSAYILFISTFDIHIIWSLMNLFLVFFYVLLLSHWTGVSLKRVFIHLCCIYCNKCTFWIETMKDIRPTFISIYRFIFLAYNSQFSEAIDDDIISNFQTVFDVITRADYLPFVSF